MRTRQPNPFEAVSSADAPDLVVPTRLRVEHLEESLGIDIELTPGYTAYAKILYAQTYDVLELLRAGANTIDVVLSDGWYRGQVGAFRQINQYGERVAFLGQMELGFDDGSQQIVATGDEWVARTGAVLAADLMQGVQ